MSHITPISESELQELRTILWDNKFPVLPLIPVTSHQPLREFLICLREKRDEIIATQMAEQKKVQDEKDQRRAVQAACSHKNAFTQRLRDNPGSDYNQYWECKDCGMWKDY